MKRSEGLSSYPQGRLKFVGIQTNTKFREVRIKHLGTLIRIQISSHLFFSSVLQTPSAINVFPLMCRPTSGPHRSTHTLAWSAEALSKWSYDTARYAVAGVCVIWRMRAPTASVHIWITAMHKLHLDSRFVFRVSCKRVIARNCFCSVP